MRVPTAWQTGLGTCPVLPPCSPSFLQGPPSQQRPSLPALEGKFLQLLIDLPCGAAVHGGLCAGPPDTRWPHVRQRLQDGSPQGKRVLPLRHVEFERVVGNHWLFSCIPCTSWVFFSLTSQAVTALVKNFPKHMVSSMQQILPIVWNTLTESAALYPFQKAQGTCCHLSGQSSPGSCIHVVPVFK